MFLLVKKCTKTALKFAIANTHVEKKDILTKEESYALE